MNAKLEKFIEKKNIIKTTGTVNMDSILDINCINYNFFAFGNSL